MPHTDQSPKARDQYNVQGAYCGLNTASEEFLVFTTQINAHLMPLKCPIVKY